MMSWQYGSTGTLFTKRAICVHLDKRMTHTIPDNMRYEQPLFARRLDILVRRRG
jgi:hypothetical protein